jgi:N4-gp56 family major capsid protein
VNQITTYGSISQRTAAWAAREMLSHAEPVLVLSKFGASKPLPSNKAKTATWRRPIPFEVSTTNMLLTEGVTPSAVQMQYEDVSATLSQYGRLVEITDHVQDLAEDPVLKDAAMMVGENMAELIEVIIWGAIKAGTSVIYANGTARTDVNTVVSLDDIRLAVRSLRSNRGKPITRILDSSPDYNTKPVEAGFVAVGHTDLEADIRNLTGFTPVAQYGSRQPLCPEEIGAVESVRFVLSPVLTAYPDAGGAKGTHKSTSGTSADVYPLVILAREAYGLVPLKGKYAITPTVINPGTVDKSDPLGQRGYVGAKTYFTALILNNAWIQRIECAVDDLA